MIRLGVYAPHGRCEATRAAATVAEFARGLGGVVRWLSPTPVDAAMGTGWEGVVRRCREDGDLIEWGLGCDRLLWFAPYSCAMETLRSCSGRVAHTLVVPRSPWAGGRLREALRYGDVVAATAGAAAPFRSADRAVRVVAWAEPPRPGMGAGGPAPDRLYVHLSRAVGRGPWRPLVAGLESFLDRRRDGVAVVFRDGTLADAPYGALRALARRGRLVLAGPTAESECTAVMARSAGVWLVGDGLESLEARALALGVPLVDPAGEFSASRPSALDARARRREFERFWLREWGL